MYLAGENVIVHNREYCSTVWGPLSLGSDLFPSVDSLIGDDSYYGQKGREEN